MEKKNQTKRILPPINVSNIEVILRDIRQKQKDGLLDDYIIEMQRRCVSENPNLNHLFDHMVFKDEQARMHFMFGMGTLYELIRKENESILIESNFNGQPHEYRKKDGE